MVKSVCIAAVTALWGSLTWLLVMTENWDEITALYVDYLVIPMLAMWLGAFVVMASIIVTAERLGDWVRLSGSLAVVAASALVFIMGGFSLPCSGSLWWSCPRPTTEGMVAAAGVGATTSLLVWAHFAVACLVQRCRRTDTRIRMP